MKARTGATVLIVDDDPGVLSILMRSLEQEGYVVVQADKGLDALDLIERQGPPDLVITDLSMPGMGGAELGRRLKARWPLLPILVLSGHSAAELLRQGAIGSDLILIEKPFSPAALVARVGTTLSLMSRS